MMFDAHKAKPASRSQLLPEEPLSEVESARNSAWQSKTTLSRRLEESDATLAK